MKRKRETTSNNENDNDNGNENEIDDVKNNMNENENDDDNNNINEDGNKNDSDSGNNNDDNNVNNNVNKNDNENNSNSNDNDNNNRNNNKMTELDIICGLEDGWAVHNMSFSVHYELENENKDRIQNLDLKWEPNEEEQEEEDVEGNVNDNNNNNENENENSNVNNNNNNDNNNENENEDSNAPNDDHDNNNDNDDDNDDDYYWNPPLFPPVAFDNTLWSTLKHIEELKLVGYPNALLTPPPPQQQLLTSYHCDNNDIDDNNDTTTITTTATAASIITETSLLIPPVSIGQLSATLTELSFEYCGREEFGFYLPPDIGMLTNLLHLSLDDVAVRFLPPEIGQLENLQVLSLSSCHILEELPIAIGNLGNHRLGYLSITDCKMLKQLPIEINNLSKSLEVFFVMHNTNLQPTRTGFTFHIRHFTKLKRLFIDRYDCCYCCNSSSRGVMGGGGGKGGGGLRRPNTLMLQSLPPSLEKLTFLSFKDSDLSILKQIPGTAAAAPPPPPPTSTTTTSICTELSSLFVLMPRNIRKMDIHERSTAPILVNKTNQDIIHDLLKKCPRLFFLIHSDACRNINFCNDDYNDNGGASRYLFTRESLYLNFFNYCGRILVDNDNNNYDVVGDDTSNKRIKRILLPLSMWPTVLEQAKERIVRKNIIEEGDYKSQEIMTASVIFSLLQGPALMEHLTTITIEQSL